MKAKYFWALADNKLMLFEKKAFLMTIFFRKFSIFLFKNMYRPLLGDLE